MTSLLTKLGSIEEILYRCIPSTSSNALIKSINNASFLGFKPSITSVPFPKSPKLTPVNTISLMPPAAIFSALATTFSIVSDLEAPLACGIVQNEHL